MTDRALYFEPIGDNEWTAHQPDGTLAGRVWFNPTFQDWQSYIVAKDGDDDRRPYFFDPIAADPDLAVAKTRVVARWAAARSRT